MFTFTRRQFIFLMLIASAYLAIALLANSWPMWVLFAFVVLLTVLPFFADRSARMAELYKPRGPRTDVRYMTRQQLFRSGGSFLLGCLLSSLVIYLIGHFATPIKPEVVSNKVKIGFLVVISIAVITAAMTFVGGIYLLTRGVLRRSNYDPSQVLAQDLLQRATMEFYRFEGVITASHEPPDIPPAQFELNEHVRIVKRDEEWPDFLWCLHEDGRSAWIPEDYLYRQDNSATLLDEYSSVELRVFVLEHVRVLNSVGGWHWCKNRRGQFGWIPATKVQPAKP